MDSELGLPPPAAKHPPPAPTTITDIGGDLLREIFILLPSLPSLVRAALACHTFLHAVRSGPAFRRRFHRLHPPQILGFFLDRTAFPTFAPLRIRSDPDLAAAVRGSDFFLTRLPHDSAHSSSGWGISTCHSGYVVLANQTTRQIAAYNPLTQALTVFPMPPEETILVRPCFFESHIVISEEDQSVFHIVFVQMSRQVPICVLVFSSATRQWQDSPVAPQPELQPENHGDAMATFHPGTQVNGFIYWKYTTQACLLILNTATMHFSRLALPVFFTKKHDKLFRLGQSKDGKLCVAGIDLSNAMFGTFISWVWRAGAGGVEKWIQGKFIPLHTLIPLDDDADARVCVEAVIDGFVYLAMKRVDQPESLISLCLKTKKTDKLFDDTYASPAHPYIMMWPPSLVYNKARRPRA